MVDISVIVPVYNVGKYIANCLNSLVNQTKKEIEIIAINDGSTDNSLNILNQYAKKYPNLIKVISQANKGMSVARNVGIQNATGKYIAFVDSDDEIELDLLERFWKKIIEYPYDIVTCNVKCIYPNKTNNILSGLDFCTEKLSKAEKNKLFLNIYVALCNKIYKRELFNDTNLLFEPNIWFEDVLFFHKLIPNLKSIAFINYSGYKYYQRENSITYTYSDRLFNINLVMEKILLYYKASNIFEEYKDELEYMYIRYMFATYIKRLAKTKDRKKFKDGIKIAKKKVKDTFPNYKKNKYLNNKSGKNLYLKYFNKTFANIIYILEKNKMN